MNLDVSFDSLYRVVVEILPDEPSERKKREASTVPCDLGNSELVDYSVATSRGLRCYIAAEIPRLVRSKTFIVGDNKTYGGYYNARLSPDSDHDVWFGLVVTVDGVCCSDSMIQCEACNVEFVAGHCFILCKDRSA